VGGQLPLARHDEGHSDDDDNGKKKWVARMSAWLASESSAAGLLQRYNITL